MNEATRTQQSKDERASARIAKASAPTGVFQQPAEKNQPFDSGHHFGEAYANGGFRQTVDTLKRHGANHGLAQETAQAAWVRGWERRHQLHNPARLVGWINGIAVNLLRDEARRTRRLTATFPPGLNFQVSPAAGPSSIDLRSALSKAPEVQRAFLDAFLSDLTPTEIADRLNISVSAVHHRLSRLRAGLRRRLTTY